MRCKKGTWIGRCALAALVAVSAASPAWALLRAMSVEQLVEDSDEVLRVTCESMKSEWVGMHLETTYRMRVEETLMGARKSGETVEVTMLGGDSPSAVPLSMKVTDAPTILQGESMILFLDQREAAEKARIEGKVPGTRMGASPRVVGLSQGKWSIIKHPESGVEIVMDPTGGRGPGHPRAEAFQGDLRMPRLYRDFRDEVLTVAGPRANAEAKARARAEFLRELEAAEKARGEKPGDAK